MCIIILTIVIENVSKQFDNTQALRHIYLEIKRNAIVALVGGSGSGKSTLLRMIAGLDSPDKGSIWLHGKNTAFMSVQEREIGFVCQSYALFPHMSVYDNIAFGLHVKKESVDQIQERLDYLLKLIELENLAHHYPRQLSGGQKQRVALARSLAPNPKVLLLDEPFAALDMRMRKELRDWVRTLHQHTSVTIIIVTHDYKEALEIASDIVMLQKGRVEQHGKPEDFYKTFVERGLI
uniref:probable transport protein n=1 Tax=Polulichloris maxima TaxID=2704661 RepID=UPI002410CB42|nr:probable transport protein [Polulichloris maxima]WDY13205.1 probable transport protein [Polulichloris maxima]